MKKNSTKMGFKNSAMIFLSTLALAAASLCWFTMGSQNYVDSMAAGVVSPSSDYVFYEAVDANRDGQISGTETYSEIATDDINTQYMVPGQTYFYKVRITNPHINANFAFILCNIDDTDGLSDKVMVTASLYNSSGNNVISTLTEESVAHYSSTANGITDAIVLTTSSLPVGQYDFYYTVKLDESASSSYEDLSMTIDDALVSFYEQ